MSGSVITEVAIVNQVFIDDRELEMNLLFWTGETNVE